MSKSYVKIRNNNDSITLRQFAEIYKINFIEKNEYTPENKVFSLDDLLNDNRDNIFSAYNATQKTILALQLKKPVTELKSSDVTADMLLPRGCYITIRDKYILYPEIVKDSNNTNFQISNENTIAFQNEQIQATLQNEPLELILKRVPKKDEDGHDIDSLDDDDYDAKRKTDDSAKIEYGCRVIGWFKTMYFSDEKYKANDVKLDDIYNLKQPFLDLSKYVISISTNVGDNGGNFSLSLPHLPLYHKQTSPSIDKQWMDRGNEIGEMANLNSNEFLGAVKSELGTFDYFSWLIQPNDLLFISFDAMQDFDDEHLSGKSYDMIALVDNVSITTNPQGAVSVDVQGRDLMKVITDDSSMYFYQGVTAGDYDVFHTFSNNMTVNRNGDVGGVRYKGSNINGGLRMLDGSIDVFFKEPNNFRLDFVMKTVMEHLANFSVVPDDLFADWGDRRTSYVIMKDIQQPKSAQ